MSMCDSTKSKIAEKWLSLIIKWLLFILLSSNCCYTKGPESFEILINMFCLILYFTLHLNLFAASVPQIRRSNRNNLGIIFLFLYKNLSCDSSKEPSR